MWINLIAFNVIWFGLIYWGNLFVPIAILLLAAHLIYFAEGKREFLLVIWVTLIGTTVDSFFHFTGLFIFSELNHIPIWLVTLWACFAATLLHSLKFLAGSKLLQFSLGFIAAPMSYLSGEKLNAVEFGYSLTTTLLTIGITWAFLLLFFYQIYKLIDYKGATKCLIK